MYRCTIDAKSPYHVELPEARERDKVHQLAEAFVVYDLTLPPAQQCPYTAELIELLAQCPAYQQDRQQSEAQRTVASESLKVLDRHAQKLIEEMYFCLRVHLLDEPYRMEEWGFDLKQTTGHIIWPRGRTGRMALLSIYIKQELSRPAALRLTRPNLEDVIVLRDEIKAIQAASRAGYTRRKKSNAIGYALSRQMTECLRAAGVFLISRRFNYRITHDLEKWGFKVVKRVSRAGNGALS
ncbi:MAG: hypothetical protein KDI62_14825 [Anaerolineae bacterium]|nr:hypothetical protein [Anaerolineae bacterium]MCB9105770.1 hypothetical protein [Anaerolineales bacterium]